MKLRLKYALVPIKAGILPSRQVKQLPSTLYLSKRRMERLKLHLFETRASLPCSVDYATVPKPGRLTRNLYQITRISPNMILRDD